MCLQLTTSSPALAAAPTSSRWTTAAATTWPAPSAAASSAGSAWKRSQTCITSGTPPPTTLRWCFPQTPYSTHAPSPFPSFSPSGCTFWGKKPWSRKKKILWQLGTLIGAPVGITLIAGIAVPAMVIGIPVYVGRKVRKWQTRKRRREMIFFSLKFTYKTENHT